MPSDSTVVIFFNAVFLAKGKGFRHLEGGKRSVGQPSASPAIRVQFSARQHLDLASRAEEMAFADYHILLFAFVDICDCLVRLADKERVVLGVVDFHVIVRIGRAFHSVSDFTRFDLLEEVENRDADACVHLLVDLDSPRSATFAISYSYEIGWRLHQLQQYLVASVALEGYNFAVPPIGLLDVGLGQSEQAGVSANRGDVSVGYWHGFWPSPIGFAGLDEKSVLVHRVAPPRTLTRSRRGCHFLSEAFFRRGGEWLDWCRGVGGPFTCIMCIH